MTLQRGDRVRVPKGTVINGTFPEGLKEAGRAYTVAVHDVTHEYGGVCYCHRDGSQDWTTSPEDPHPVALTNGHGKHCSPPTPAQVCWVGTGGYWHYADLNDVEVMGDES